MPDLSVLYPGRFLKKEALAAPKVIRIVKVESTILEGEKGPESKVVLAYKSADGDGEIVLCKTNAELIAVVLSTRDYAEWTGRLVTIHSNPNVDLGGKKVGGIRVYGSPEMTESKTVEIKRPRRKKAEVYKLTPTDKLGRDIGAPKHATTPAAEAPPLDDADAPPPEHWDAVDSAEVA